MFVFLDCKSTHLVMRRQYWLEPRPDELPHAVNGSAVEVALKRCKFFQLMNIQGPSFYRVIHLVAGQILLTSHHVKSSASVYCRTTLQKIVLDHMDITLYVNFQINMYLP